MAQLKDTVISGNLRVTDTILTDSLKIDGGTSGQFLKADGSVDTNTYALASAVPSAVTESTVSGWGFTKNVAPGTLITNATTAQTASSGEAMSGSITLHKVAKTGTYSDLIGTPTIPAAPGTLNTNNTTAQTASASEALSGTIKLHKVAKTGTYSDLIGTPTIPTESTVAGWGFTKNTGTLTTETDPVFSASAAAGITASDITNWNGKTSNTGTVTGVKINGTTKTPTSGTVDLGTVITSETSLSKGTTTGTGNAVTDISVSGHQITLTKGSTFLTSETQLSKGTGSGSGNVVTDISVSNHQITLTKGSTVPVATSANAGKIPRITSGGAWEYVTPSAIYSGSGTPSNSTGNNGDIYLQM